MRILITNGHLNIGGVEKSIVNLLKSLDYNKYDVDLLLFEDYGDYLCDIPESVNVILFDLKPTYGSLSEVIRTEFKNKNFKNIIIKIILTLSNKISMKFLKLLRLYISNYKYDAAIAYRVGFPAEYVAYVVKAKSNSVWWHNGQFGYEQKTVSRWRKTFRKFDNIVCVSEATHQLIKPYFAEYDKKIQIIPNMILRNELITKSFLFNPYEDLTNNSLILCSVGRLSSEKHFTDIIYVAKKLKESNYDFFWSIVGDGIERKEIEKLICDFGLCHNIKLYGAQDNPYPYIKYADIFVHPSYVESQGITVLEAMALNKTCVITKSIGTVEFVTNGKNAIQAEQNIDDLFYKTKYVIDNFDSIDQSDYQNATVSNFYPDVVIKRMDELLIES